MYRFPFVNDLVWWECCKVNGKNLSMICSGIKWFKALNIYVPTSYSMMSRTLSHCSFLSNAEWSARSKGIPVIIRAALFCRFCSLSLSASPQFPQTTLQYLIWVISDMRLNKWTELQFAKFQNILTSVSWFHAWTPALELQTKNAMEIMCWDIQLRSWKKRRH